MKSVLMPPPPLVSLVRATGDLNRSLERAVQAIGGWDWLHSDDVVLVKPNYNSPHPPPGSLAIDFLRSTLCLLQEHGARTLIIGESTSYPNHRRVLEQAGVLPLAREMGVRVVVFDEE